MGKRNPDGTFKRTRTKWTPSNWNNGYIDNKGRFRVYRPDYPNAYQGGYALRSHVVWWLKTGVVASIDTQLHHKDENKLNDSLSNLILLTHSQHRKIHQGNDVTLNCEHCLKDFIVKFSRAQERVVRFCSQSCFHSHPRTKDHKEAISIALKKAYKNGVR